MPESTDGVVWDDVRAELDAQGYPGRPIDGQGLILSSVLNVALYALRAQAAAGTLDAAPEIEVKVIENERGGSCLALYVRSEDEPRWTT